MGLSSRRSGSEQRGPSGRGREWIRVRWRGNKCGSIAGRVSRVAISCRHAGKLENLSKLLRKLQIALINDTDFSEFVV